MRWPLSQEINEAVQNPSSAFADADLKAGCVGTSPLGVPLPRSGNYADVYQVSGSDGRAWAAKCFTRPVPPDLQARYEAIAAHLAEVKLPFTVGFEFQPEGLRVRGTPYPLVKMQWVEGFAVNAFVKDHLARPAMLEGLLAIWVRLCRRLREARMAHGDLQHGNVILVPAQGRAALELKLVDYDGMFVPALAGRPTGEAGHASFQHPQRVTTNNYSIDLDRFPHLVVAAALRGLIGLGPQLWAKHDTGDNLLLTSRDFQNPGQSAVLREFWQQGDAGCRALAGHLALACTRPLPATPWLDDLMPEGRPEPLTPAAESEVRQVLGIPAIVPAGAPEFAGLASEPVTRAPRRAPASVRFNWIIGGIAAAMLAALGVGYGLGAFNSQPNDVAVVPPPPRREPQPVPPPPSPAESPVVAPDPPEKPKPEPKQAEPDKPPEPPQVQNVVAAKPLWSHQAPPGSNYITVTHSPDGTIAIATLEKTGAIHTFEAATGQRLAEFAEHEATDRVLAAALPGGRVISGGREPVLLVWNARTGEVVARVPRRPEGVVQALQVDRAGKIALVATGKRIELIDLENPREIQSYDLPHAANSGKAAAMLAPDGSSLLAITANNTLRSESIPPGSFMEVLLQMPRAMRIMAWHPGVRRAALLQDNPPGSPIIIHLVDTASGRTIKSIEGTRGRCAFTPDGSHLAAVTTTPGHFDFFDAATGELKSRVPLEGRHEAFDVAVSPDGSQAVFGGFNRHLVAVESPVGARVALVPAPKEPAAPAPNRPAPPDDASVARSEQAVRAQFEALFARPDPGSRRRLAEALEEAAAIPTQPPPTRWYINRQLLALAQELHDCPLGERAIARLDADFAVDALAMRMAMYEAIGAAVVRPDAVRAFADASGDFAAQRTDADDFPNAMKLVALAREALQRVAQYGLAREFDQRHARLREQSQQYELAKPALAKLEQTPDDAEANLAAGRYRCLVMERWAAGLPNFAAGSDAELKRIAGLELANGNPAEIADAWWAWGETQPAEIKAAVQRRARRHYVAVLQSGSAEEKLIAMDRLAFRMEGQEFRPGLIVEILSVPDRRPRATKLSMKAEILASSYNDLPGTGFGARFSGLLVPPERGKYTLRIAGRSRAFLKVFYRTHEEKMPININNPDAGDDERSAEIVLPDRPVPIYLEVALQTRGRGANPQQSAVLRWTRPDGVEEAVPPHAFFHAKAHESQLTEK